VNQDAAHKSGSGERSSYARPEIIDYGSLLDLTLAAGSPNADSPTGDNNAYPNYSPS